MFSSQKVALLILLTVLVIGLGLFGVVSSGASEPSSGIKINAVSDQSFPLNQSAAQPPQEQSRKKFAVVIGIVYDNYDLGLVDFADRDAVSVYNLLIQKMGFPAQNVILLRNSEATNANINNALSWLVNNPEIDSSSDVVFYYSGHGLRNEATGVFSNPALAAGYALVPFDFKIFDYKSGQGLFTDSYFADIFSRINSARMWFTVDSCFSGGFNRPGINGPNRVVTLSSQWNELSSEIKEAGKGVFTQYLVEEGMARGLSVEQAFMAAAPRASGGYGQNPLIVDNYPGSLDFSPPAND